MEMERPARQASDEGNWNVSVADSRPREAVWKTGKCDDHVVASWDKYRSCSISRFLTCEIREWVYLVMYSINCHVEVKIAAAAAAACSGRTLSFLRLQSDEKYKGQYLKPAGSTFHVDFIYSNSSFPLAWSGGMNRVIRRQISVIFAVIECISEGKVRRSWIREPVKWYRKEILQRKFCAKQTFSSLTDFLDWSVWVYFNHLCEFQYSKHYSTVHIHYSTYICTLQYCSA